MVFGWINSRQRSSIISEDEGRRKSIAEEMAERPGLVPRRLSMDSPLWVDEWEDIQQKRQPQRQLSLPGSQSNNQVQEQPQQQGAPPLRRRSIFDIRAPFGSDRFSREYADQMDDMWVSSLEQGDAGHAGKSLFGGDLFQRKVQFGQDEFSREYFDAMEDTFVAETDHGDAGFVGHNPHHPTFNRIPESLRRISQTLYRPVKIGTDEFSQEYAREGEDVWLAQAGKGPSARAPSQFMQRFRLGSDGDGQSR